MPELLIAEKPSAAQKIANALADGKPTKLTHLKQVPYYELKHKGKKIYVVAAVGHLYGLIRKEKGWTYPYFDVEWKEAYLISKGSDYTKKYLDLIKKIAKECDKFTICTDYDIEGEVIGWNILRFACKQKDANRMKFSTLTTDELIESYTNKDKHLDWGQAYAGETRTYLDFYFGINLSTALTLSIKNATKLYQVLSTGRVQGPALKILAKKELDIQKFKPEPYWQVELKCKEIDAWHEKDKFTDKKEVDKVMNKCESKDAIVESIQIKKFNQNPPNPFDLTSLQTEAYRTLGISPTNFIFCSRVIY